MIYFLLSILIFTNVFGYTIINGTFDNENVLEGYITPEDNILIFSYNISGKMALYKYEKLSNSNTYPKGYELKLEPFPENSSDILNNDFYIHIKQAGPTTIKFAIFNEKYLSSYTYNESSDYYLVSMEKIGPNQFAFFYNSNSTLLNNAIRIASFNFKNKAFNFTKSYLINDINERANCYCVKSSNNNIICGLIEDNIIKPKTVEKDDIYYYLLLLQDKTPIRKIRIFNYSPANYRESNVNGLFEAHFIKLIPLENEKIVYCLIELISDSGDLYCGLFQIKDNSNIEILITNRRILNSIPKSNYLRRNIFSTIKFNNNEILLSSTVLALYYKDVTKLTVNNNDFKTEKKYLNHTISSNKFIPDFIQILKNKYNDTIFLIIEKGVAKFHEFGYSICNNSNQNYLYNGLERDLIFNYKPGLFKGHDYDIVFTGNLNSIVYGSKRKRVKYGTIYNSTELYYKLSLDDLDSIKNTLQYNITFRNTLDEKESQTCILTLNFYPCDEECDICGDDCYDKHWDKVDKNKKKSKTFIIIVSVLIFLTIISIIILLIVGVLRGIKLSQNLNRNGNLNVGNILNENLAQ